MDYHGPTRDGPRVCLHNAPIDAICVECAREALDNFDKLKPSSDALVSALETLAEMGQPARMTLGAYSYINVIKAAFDGYYYHYHLADELAATISTRGACMAAVSRYRASMKRSAKVRREREPSLAEMEREA